MMIGMIGPTTMILEVLHGATSLALALARRRLAGLDPSIRPESERSTLSLL